MANAKHEGLAHFLGRLLEQGADAFALDHVTEDGSVKVGEVPARDGKDARPYGFIEGELDELAEQDAKGLPGVQRYWIRGLKGEKSLGRFRLEMDGQVAPSDKLGPTEGPTAAGAQALSMRHIEGLYRMNHIQLSGLSGSWAALSGARDSFVQDLRQELARKDERIKQLEADRDNLSANFWKKGLEQIEIVQKLTSTENERIIGEKRLLLEEKKTDRLWNKAEGFLDLFLAKTFGAVTGDKRAAALPLAESLFKRLDGEKLDQLIGIMSQDPVAAQIFAELYMTISAPVVKRDDANKEDKEATTTNGKAATS